MDNPHILMLKNESLSFIKYENQPLHRSRAQKGSTLVGFCYFLAGIAC